MMPPEEASATHGSVLAELFMSKARPLCEKIRLFCQAVPELDVRLDGPQAPSGRFILLCGDAMSTKFKSILRTILMLVLVVTVGLMIVEIHRLQGTAQVVNYAGIVRGASQRLVKLEITGNEYDQLRNDLNHYINALRKGGGSMDLIRLDDPLFQSRLETQAEYWSELKEELANVRNEGLAKSDIINESEIYFHLCDDTVNAAVDYSERIASNIRILEGFSILSIVGLIALFLYETVKLVAVRRENVVLKKKAYFDLHTGLPNKSRCEELLHDVSFLDKTTACLVFDINNLKEVNDNLGHTAGDLLIQNFARQLRRAVPPQHTVARYGGDEFLVVARNVTSGTVESLVTSIRHQFERFNRSTNSIPISFAYGWAHSEAYEQCTLRTLFDAADKSMYDNKIKSKQGRAASRPATQEPGHEEPPQTA